MNQSGFEINLHKKSKSFVPCGSQHKPYIMICPRFGMIFVLLQIDRTLPKSSDGLSEMEVNDRFLNINDNEYFLNLIMDG